MPALLILFAATMAAPAATPTTACRPDQLQLSIGRPAGSGGAAHTGAELSIRNMGKDCLLPALPVIELRDARGRLLPALRRSPTGMHPGPVVIPVRLSGGHRAAASLRWVSSPVYARAGALRATGLIIRLGRAQLGVPFGAVLYRAGAEPARFDQAPFRVLEGLAGD
jgi:hypothetical protein